MGAYAQHNSPLNDKIKKAFKRRRASISKFIDNNPADFDTLQSKHNMHTKYVSINNEMSTARDRLHEWCHSQRRNVEHIVNQLNENEHYALCVVVNVEWDSNEHAAHNHRVVMNLYDKYPSRCALNNRNYFFDCRIRQIENIYHNPIDKQRVNINNRQCDMIRDPLYFRNYL
eukprot:65194_1